MTVRLMSDYGAGWPLWGAEGQLDSSAFPLTPELAARLRAWQEFFETRFHHERGWRSPSDAITYAAEGRQLQHLLTTEIGHRENVELDLWPVAA